MACPAPDSAAWSLASADTMAAFCARSRRPGPALCGRGLPRDDPTALALLEARRVPIVGEPTRPCKSAIDAVFLAEGGPLTLLALLS